MKKILWLIAIILVIFVLYRIFRDQPIGVTGPKPITVALAAINYSGVNGQAILNEVDGQTQVAIKLSRISPEFEPQSAYLQKGSCVALGEPIYNLKPIESGVSETTLTVALAAITDNLPLAVGVYSSETGTDAKTSGLLAACGGITIND